MVMDSTRLSSAPPARGVPPGVIELRLCFTQDARLGGLREAYRRILSEDERDRNERFRHGNVRDDDLITRALVRCSLSEFFPIPPSQWKFRRTRHGRPEVCAPPVPVRFNVSHTRGLVALALTAACDVGIDVETFEVETKRIELARRFFAPEESSAILAAPPRDGESRFVELWTLKEAYLKALGFGLSIPLDAFAVVFDANGKLTLRLNNLPGRAGEWQLLLLAPNSRYRAALAVRRGDAPDLKLNAASTVPLREVNPVRVDILATTPIRR